MHAQQALEAFKLLLAVTAPEVQAVLSDPAERQKLYKLLVNEPLQPLSVLVRAAFQKELEYRDALWEGTVEDSGEFYEGIYRCAFLLYRLGNTEDIHTLWQAKHLNMDVGSSMGAEFFIGAGLHETIAFIEHTSLSESANIAEYIGDYFFQPDAMQWQERWEEDMYANIRDA